ncbi:hypothetical protein SCHPADRAFT_844808 [Schizopora paradoxa]|uniref:Fe2OG dioxygenase domain-containing protein n=1 Tax=Schizopora paradoxa TaxID=27342 RepID=A0A0H2SA29_9AGAM|nr:hypothetical protein SCHPADRAFT_844808 [Schizopora paradoxa]
MFSNAQLHQKNERAYKKALRNERRTAQPGRSPDDHEWTPFRLAEKKYKVKFPPPDLSGVLDLALLDSERDGEIQRSAWAGSATAQEFKNVGTCRGRKVYCLPRVPGLIVMPGHLTPEEQRALVRWSLCDHAKAPNETNLDTHYNIPSEGIWSLHFQCKSALLDPSKKSPDRISPRKAGPSTVAPPPGPRQLISNTAADPSNFCDLAKEPKPLAAPSPALAHATASELLPKLRWANIGWFYHWGTKQYDFSRPRVEIGECVWKLCTDIVRALPWSTIFKRPEGGNGPLADHVDWMSWENEYEPDAGIVNFYQLKDTLMGHVDRSEVCATSPLVSISLGNAAVFLIGGHSRDQEPTPLLLRSGDVVVMSGPQCRRAYHGVPRVLDGTLPDHLLSFGEDLESELFESYLRTTRININVRQVFPKGFDPWKQGASEPISDSCSASDADV